MIYLGLFWEFFKVGLFAVGGGMATIPFLMDMSVRTGWFTTSELADMIAVSESTPGPMGVNIARLLLKFHENPLVKTTFSYLRPAVIGLISYALYEVARLTFIDTDGPMALPCIACILMLAAMHKFKNIHPVVWIGLGAVFGLVFL